MVLEFRIFRVKRYLNFKASFHFSLFLLSVSDRQYFEKHFTNHFIEELHP